CLVHRDTVDTVPNFRIGVRKFVLGFQTAVYRSPCLAGIVGSEHASRGDSNEDPLRILAVKHDRVQTHSACSRLPEVAFRAAKPCKFVPGLSTICGTEQGRVLYPRKDRIRIAQRRFKMPDSLELPGTLCTVVPLMGGERLAGRGGRIVDKFIALSLGRAIRCRGRFARRCTRLVPRLAAIVRALDDLSEPT